MRAEIITIGSELIAGRTIDTHSSYLSKQCLQIGIEVLLHTSVGDDEKKLLHLLSIASSRSTLIFLCGGLGPTKDDLTKETLAKYLGFELVQDSDTLRRLEQMFSNRDVIPPNNIKQTYVFPTGKIFANDHGTAPGLAVTKDEIVYILLPGPPSELIPMFQSSIQPFLKQLNNNSREISSHILSFFGIGESFLEDCLQDVMASNEQLIIAPYANDAEIALCITAKEKNSYQAKQEIQRVRNEILKRFGDSCFSEDGKSLEEVVIAFLKECGSTIAFAESCTGGLLSYLLSTVPGSSKAFKGGWVCYTNEVKKEIVGVSNDILEKYGAVSINTAHELACLALNKFNSDFALSITGVAGPISTEDKPIGLVFIGFAQRGEPTRTYQFQFTGRRKRIQLLAAKYALFILLQQIKKGELNEAF